MLEWYNQYFINYNININDNDINCYINKLSNKNINKSIINKVNQIEIEYEEKLNEIKLLCLNFEEIDKIKTKNSLIILQKELEIIKLLTKYTLQNKNLNYNFFLSCLNFLYTLSETLRNRINQKELIHNKIKNNDDAIIRCSYKFCSYKENCNFNYNSKIKNLCYQDHYVHNMVSADLKILIDYITQKYSTTNIVLHNKEILKTINTLSYVISHMEMELRTKCLSIPDTKWENNHIIKVI
jgi:hypothetical protein